MAEINRDPEVTRYLNRPVDAQAVAAFFGVVVGHWDQHGFGFFAIESREDETLGQFIGFVGVAYPTFLPELAERPELGWRLARRAWGRGLATEAATAAREDAFDRLLLPELISIIHPDNLRSQRLASKLDMSIERQIHNPVLARDTDVWQLPGPPDSATRKRSFNERIRSPAGAVHPSLPRSPRGTHATR